MEGKRAKQISQPLLWQASRPGKLAFNYQSIDDRIKQRIGVKAFAQQKAPKRIKRSVATLSSSRMTFSCQFIQNQSTTIITTTITSRSGHERGNNKEQLVNPRAKLKLRNQDHHRVCVTIRADGLIETFLVSVVAELWPLMYVKRTELVFSVSTKALVISRLALGEGLS